MVKQNQGSTVTGPGPVERPSPRPTRPLLSLFMVNEDGKKDVLPCP